MDHINRHTLILGGARSGKSKFAEDVVLGLSRQRFVAPIYIATAQIWDDEMGARVDQHRARRDETWTTIDAPLDLVAALFKSHNKSQSHAQPILVDCLTLWLTNLMMADKDVDAEGDALIACLPDLKCPVCFVSNEVGQGIIPDNKMARDFMDHAGLLHQKLSQAVDEVYFVTAGLPQKLKG